MGDEIANVKIKLCKSIMLELGGTHGNELIYQDDRLWKYMV